ncbi:MAG: DUF4336 domain-containing protein [Salaquimonas sp.]|jgi:hypothetical protein|nr:DUF4336 domain-containing protein [Salaquimonas sp.]
MTGGYDAYEPQNKLKAIGEEIWIADGPVLQWGYGIPITFPFPTRMTVIRLSDGDLFVHSPIHADEDLVAQVEKLGPIAHIVSPNMIHHVSIKAWAARYPDAKTWASPGVRKRSDVEFSRDLDDLPPKEWADDIDQRIARGSRVMEEVIFFHMRSKTLILADLIENFEADRLHGWFNHFMYRLIGVMAPHGKAPRDLRATYAGHHDQMRGVVDWMIACAPERIVIAHGKWIEENAVEELRLAFDWVK